jgi:hypothetical protein
VGTILAKARARPLVLIGLTVLLLLLLWMEAIPPGASPDEESHFVRLGGIATGHPLGTPPAVAPPEFDEFLPSQIERVRRESGTFHVDAKYLYISGGDCNSFLSDVPACAAPLPHVVTPTVVSVHAHSQIAGYLLPAILSRFGWSGRSTFYLARLGIALAATCLVMCGFISVRRASPDVDLAFLGAGVTVTIAPLVAFLGGVIAPGVIGAFGAVALCMCTWAIVKASAVRIADRVLWLVALTAACCSESVGFAYAALAILAGLAAAWSPPKRLAARLRLPALVTGGAIVLGAGLWDLLLKVHLAHNESRKSISTLTHNFSVVWRTSLDAANHLGWLDVSMPLIVKLIWVGLIIWWIIWSVAFGDWRWAVTLGGLACGFFAIGIAVAHSVAPTGFAVQARYLLPGICIVPMAVALRLSRLPLEDRERVRPRLTVGLWAAGMTFALFALLRRHVVGAQGPIWFFGHGVFRPLGGWLLLAITFVAFLAAAGLLASARSTSTPQVAAPPYASTTGTLE